MRYSRPMTTKLNLHQDTSITLIRSYEDGKLLIGNTQYSSSVIVTSASCTGWSLTSIGALTPEHFAPLFELDFKPELVILGTGPKLHFPKPAQTLSLVSAQIGLEVMDTGAASRTFNVLADEGRRVVACLLV